MLPVIFHPAKISVGLAGHGDGLARRAALLRDAAVEPRLIPQDATPAMLEGLRLLFVAGLPHDNSTRLATAARQAGIAVNVEDVPELCDFHVPASLRRGDLLFTVSTAGQAPGLSHQLREWLENRFTSDWDSHLDELSHHRKAWRAEGLTPSDVSRKTRDFVTQKGWLS